MLTVTGRSIHRMTHLHVWHASWQQASSCSSHVLQQPLCALKAGHLVDGHQLARWAAIHDQGHSCYGIRHALSLQHNMLSAGSTLMAVLQAKPSHKFTENKAESCMLGSAPQTGPQLLWGPPRSQPAKRCQYLVSVQKADPSPRREQRPSHKCSYGYWPARCMPASQCHHEEPAQSSPMHSTGNTSAAGSGCSCLQQCWSQPQQHQAS